MLEKGTDFPGNLLERSTYACHLSFSLQLDSRNEGRTSNDRKQTWKLIRSLFWWNVTFVDRKTKQALKWKARLNIWNWSFKAPKVVQKYWNLKGSSNSFDAKAPNSFVRLIFSSTTSMRYTVRPIVDKAPKFDYSHCLTRSKITLQQSRFPMYLYLYLVSIVKPYLYKFLTIENIL